MIHWVIEPSIISGCELEYPDTVRHEAEKYNYVLILSNSPNKYYSIASKVNKKTINNSLKEPKLVLDKTTLGPLVKGDKINLRSYNPPIAKQVLLAINEKYFLVGGNWGSKIVNPAVSGQIVDIGQSIDFMYGSENPMFVSSQVKATIPKGPALIDNQTIFIVEKLSTDVLAKLKINSEKYSEIRAKEFFNLIEQENFDLINSVRNDSANKIEKTFAFSQIDPRSIYKAFKQLLEGLNQIFIHDDYNIIGDNQLSLILSIPKTKKGVPPNYSIEFKMSSSLKQGVCFLTGFSLEKDQLTPILERIDKQLRQMSLFLKETPQIIPDNCAGCGWRLNLTQQNDKGVVFCEKCKAPNILPFALRT